MRRGCGGSSPLSSSLPCPCFRFARLRATAAINAAARARCAASLAARAVRSRASSIARCSRLRRAYAAQAARKAAAPPHRGRCPKGRRGAGGVVSSTRTAGFITIGPVLRPPSPRHRARGCVLTCRPWTPSDSYKQIFHGGTLLCLFSSSSHSRMAFSR